MFGIDEENFQKAAPVFLSGIGNGLFRIVLPLFILLFKEA